MKNKIALGLLLFSISTFAQVENESLNTDTVIITTGANGLSYKFIKDTSIPNLGEAWKDPSGMIWGDIAKNADGSIRYINQINADKYCKSINANLPSDEDFIRLREYLGAVPNSERADGYTPQVLPNLIDNNFWASPVVTDPRTLAYVFKGSSGILGYVFHGPDDVSSVRCVSKPTRPRNPICDFPDMCRH